MLITDGKYDTFRLFFISGSVVLTLVILVNKGNHIALFCTRNAHIVLWI